MPKKEGRRQKSLSNYLELHKRAQSDLKWRLNKKVFDTMYFWLRAQHLTLRGIHVILYFRKKSRKMHQIKLFIIQFHILEKQRKKKSYYFHYVLAYHFIHSPQFCHSLDRSVFNTRKKKNCTYLLQTRLRQNHQNNKGRLNILYRYTYLISQKCINIHYYTNVQKYLYFFVQIYSKQAQIPEQGRRIWGLEEKCLRRSCPSWTILQSQS